MQRFLIKCVNFALLIIIVIGLPAVTRAQFWNVQIVSAPKLQLLSFWGLSLALGGNILAASMLFNPTPATGAGVKISGGILLGF